MRLFIDEKPIETFSARQLREVSARAPGAGRIDAVVLDLAEADRRVARAGRIFYGALGGLVAFILGGVMIGFVFGGDASDAAIIVPVALLSAVICAFLLRFGYRRGLGHWAAHREARAAALAGPGTQVIADGSGLAIGVSRASWAALDIEALYFNEVNVNEDRTYRVERLALTDGRRRFIIDRDFLTEGDGIVRWAYAKLVVERGFEELRGEPANPQAA